jgi:hypothetical protein
MVILDPGGTWERIEKEQHGVARVFAISTLPLLVVVSVVEAYGLMTWGRERAMSGRTRALGTDLLLRYEITQFILALVLLFFGAWLLKLIAEGFHRRHSYQQSFVTAAYALGPLFLSRMLNAIPGVNLWITWGIGIALVLAALYRGVPRTMKPDPSNALGLYIMASLVLILSSGLANFVAIMVLDEKIPATYQRPL